MTNMTRRDFFKMMGIMGVSVIGLGGCTLDNNSNLTEEEKIHLALKGGQSRREIADIYLNSNKNIDDDVRSIIRELYPLLENADENYFIFAMKQISLIRVNYETISNRPNKYTKTICQFPCDITYYKNQNDKVNADYIFPEICSWLAVKTAIQSEAKRLNTYTKEEIITAYLSQNSFLTDKEKEVINPIIDFLDKYVDGDNFLNALATLRYIRVVYESEEMGNGFKSKCDSPYRIYCYETDKNRQSYYILKEAFEAIHISDKINTLDEGMSKVLAREYAGFRDSNAYGDTARLIKILCEILGPQTILNCYLNNDFAGLKEPLLKINPDEEKAEEFLYYLKLALDNYSYPAMTAEDFHKKCDSYFIGYFNDKYGLKANDDFIMKDYLKLFKSGENKYRVSKTYFNEEEMVNDVVIYENGDVKPLDEVFSRTRNIEKTMNFWK